MATPSTPIRRILMRMIFLSSGAVLAVTTAAFCTYEAVTFRNANIEQLQTLGEVIASNSTAALAFENSEDATAVLAAFKANPHIVAAALYDAHGQVFATYPRGLSAGRLPARIGAPGYSFAHGAQIGFNEQSTESLRALSNRLNTD